MNSISQFNYDGEFQQAWADSSNTQFELPPVDVDRLNPQPVCICKYVLLIAANISSSIYKELGFNTVCAGLGTGNGQVLIATHKLFIRLTRQRSL